MNTRALSDFKAFILRGNVVDLAVGVVIGAAFSGVVTAMVKDIITPVIGIFFNPKNNSFANMFFLINGSQFLIGDFINAVISFLIIASVVFFFVVRPVNYLMSRRKTELPLDPTTRDCPFCLSSIPIKAVRCAFCTSEVSVEATIQH